ncbi:MAG TPA: hypothetical protein DDZ84_01915 [Firmicutes bacterium]|nr:hypothetical protein [Bacillota bacterium]
MEVSLMNSNVAADPDSQCACAAVLDRDLTIRRCDRLWTSITARLARCTADAVTTGANISQLVQPVFPEWNARYQRVLAGESTYDRIVFRGSAAGALPETASTSWDVYAVPIADHGHVSSIIEFVVNAKQRVESAVLEALPDVCFVLDQRGLVLACHGGTLSDVFGAPSSLIGKRFSDLLPEIDRPRVDAALAQVAQSAQGVWARYQIRTESPTSAGISDAGVAGGAGGVGKELRRARAGIEVLGASGNGGAVASIEFHLENGLENRVFEVRFSPLSEPGYVVIIREVTDARRAQAIQEGQSKLLELLARGGSFSDTLSALITILEEQFPGLSALVLLMDDGRKRLRVGASGRLPPEYLDCIEGLPIGPSNGSSAAAAYLGDSIIVEDIATDPRWSNHRNIALGFGFRACWAQPILDDQGDVLGTFAMYQTTSRGPSRVEARAMENAARLVRVAIDQQKAKEELQATYEQLEQRIEERTREIEQRRRVAEGLRDVLAALNSNRPLAEVLDLILAQAERFLGAEAALLCQLEPEAGVLRVMAARGLDGDDAARAAACIDDDVFEQTTAAEHPAVVQKAPGWPLDRFCSMLVIPFLGISQMRGAIALCFSSPRSFSNEDFGLAMSHSDQAALAIANAQLKAKAEKAAVAAERSRLARDLHDAVTQTLFSASLIAEVLPRLWEQNQTEGRRRLEQLRQMTRGALAEMRSLLMELRPATLTEVGLEDLLKQLAEATVGRTGIPVDLIAGGSTQCSLPAQVKIALYRIAQEALANVAKHSGADHASVNLTCDVDSRACRAGSDQRDISVQLCIRDTGRGFVMKDVSAQCLGLSIMRERASGVGAELAVDSCPGHGTTITATWQGIGPRS